MTLSYKWLRRLTDRSLDLRFQHHADQKPSDIQDYWGTVLGVEPDSIRFQRKSNSGEMSGRNWRSKHGVLTIRVADTLLRARLEAWMDRLRRDWTQI